jgi:hypothetical protein
VRLRVLDLPSSSDPEDHDTPYLLILDRVADHEVDDARQAVTPDIRKRIGARGMLAFRSSVDLGED